MSAQGLADLLLLSAKVALVTGGSGGIGSAIVRLLLDAGAKVASVDLPGRETPAGALGLESDLRDGAAVRDLLGRFGDRFDRLVVLLKNHATLGQTARYFLFKVPLVVTQPVPPAVLTALILMLGMLSRRNEIVDLRASGVSLGQMAVPLFGAAAVVSLTVLAWSETVVPYCTRRFEHINNVEA